jgi:hypothetical protein
MLGWLVSSHPRFFTIKSFYLDVAAGMQRIETIFLFEKFKICAHFPPLLPKIAEM